MNLIKDKWISVKRIDGLNYTIAPWEIGASDNPVVEITAPRPDFRGAVYQFLIGLTQTALAPKDDDEWEERWNDIPSCDELRIAFEKFADAFELINENGPAFMQDFNLPDSAKLDEIQSLLIDSPGENTINENRDYFVKRETIKGLCASCTVIALFTLQINASSGGAGHRTSLRGGGPLTTLVVPASPDSVIWGKIWCNILSNEEKFSVPRSASSDIFPWMGKTKDSEPPEESKEEKLLRLKLIKKERDKIKKEREKTKAIFPYSVNELQLYWGMPRRIRIEASKDSGICDCCGKKDRLWISYKGKNYGNNYSSTWQHTLTPYFRKAEDDGSFALISIKGKEGGFSYPDWLSLTIGGNENYLAATVVRSFNERKVFKIMSQPNAHIWCFGYDMDNDKARCWYDQTMPLIALSDDRRTIFVETMVKLIAAAKECAELIRKCILIAWKGAYDHKKHEFNLNNLSAKEKSSADKSTAYIASLFLEETESSFFNFVEKIRFSIEVNKSTANILFEWRATIIESAERLFDRFAIQENDEIKNMKRIAEAAKALTNILRSPKTKSIQALKEAL